MLISQINNKKRKMLNYFLALELDKGVLDLGAEPRRDRHDGFGVFHHKSDEPDGQQFVIVRFIGRAHDAPVKSVDHLNG